MKSLSERLAAAIAKRNQEKADETEVVRMPGNIGLSGATALLRQHFSSEGATLNALRKALSSGEVQSWFRSMGLPQPIQPKLWAGAIIDLSSRWQVELRGWLAYDSWQFEVNEQDLRAWLLSQALVQPAPVVQKDGKALVEPKVDNEAASATDRTGAPGRPTSRHLVMEELLRRQRAGETLATLAAEAKALMHWLASTHPALAQMQPPTAENCIRKAYNAWKSNTSKLSTA